MSGDLLYPLSQSAAFAAAAGGVLTPMSDGGHVVILSRGPGVRFASRGPVYSAETSIGDRIGQLRACRLHLVNAAGGTADVVRAAGFRQIMTGASIAQLPTQTDMDAQLAQAHPKWRNAARQAMRSDAVFQVRPFDDRLDRWLFQREEQMQKDRGYRAYPAELVRRMCRFDRNTGVVAIAIRNDQPIAAMLFIRHGWRATYQTGWSGTNGRAVCAHHGLLCLAAVHLHASGVRDIELGQLDTDRLPGLARFKLGAGAWIDRLDGTWIRAPGWRG